MSSGEAISMEEPKKKLLDLKNYMPAPNDLVFDYAKFLCGYLKDTMEPLEFGLAATFALNALEKGVDPITGERIHNKLVGYPQMIYDLIGKQMPAIADAIFPEDFAEEVKEYVEI